MGFGEILIVILVALIVLGPDKLPQVAKFAGRVFYKIQKFSTAIHTEVDEHIKQEMLSDNIKKAEAVDKLYDN